MPIYEFKCEKCEKTEEFLLKFSEAKPTTCSSCGGPIHQLISQTSFALKGSGWYVTDYKSNSKSEGSKAQTDSKSSESPPPANSSTSSEPSATAPSTTSTT